MSLRLIHFLVVDVLDLPFPEETTQSTVVHFSAVIV